MVYPQQPKRRYPTLSMLQQNISTCISSMASASTLSHLLVNGLALALFPAGCGHF